MISPELLRRHSFFGFMDDAQQKAVAMIAEEVAFEKDATIIKANTPATTLYFLLEGSVGLYFIVEDGHNRKELFISDINLGEIFGISALVDPYHYTAAIRANTHCRVIKIDAISLRALSQVDNRLACNLMREVAKSLMQRLHDTRVQLAAAHA
jgi:CRP/FNR family cyclic AMP-dependent transcriptional regulator